MRIVRDSEGTADELLLVVHSRAADHVKARGIHNHLCVALGKDSAGEESGEGGETLHSQVLCFLLFLHEEVVLESRAPASLHKNPQLQRWILGQCLEIIYPLVGVRRRKRVRRRVALTLAQEFVMIKMSSRLL